LLTEKTMIFEKPEEQYSRETRKCTRESRGRGNACGLPITDIRQN
jgi:hypothetical protein